jgi:hypothetical protein
MILCLLVAAAAGCSDGRPPTYPVSGQVVFDDGSPVHVGTVELKSREHNLHARGEIDPRGNFTLTTFERGDGAVAGTHDCVVVQMVMAEDVANLRPSSEGVVNPRYGSYATSGLVVHVNDEDPNELLLNVEPLAPREDPAGESSHTRDHAHLRKGADRASPR